MLENWHLPKSDVNLATGGPLKIYLHLNSFIYIYLLNYKRSRMINRYNIYEQLKNLIKPGGPPIFQSRRTVRLSYVFSFFSADILHALMAKNKIYVLDNSARSG